ncbi:MAG TPA: SBBP repeat-containing protein [candidate division Zixibacteria bacterium]|nr:SBBP repeat-containing protein [candidate division Zixibacteria bacterium]
MRNHLALQLLLILGSLVTIGISAPAAQQPVSFTENKGQWPDSVMFRAGGNGVTLWITRSGVYYQFSRSVGDRQPGSASSAVDPSRLPGRFQSRRDSVESILVGASFIGSNLNAQVIGDGLTDYKCNYFLGNDPSKWRSNVPNYESVTIHDLYPGIDLKFASNGDGDLSYQYVGAPGANLSRVKMKYSRNGTAIGVAEAESITRANWGEPDALLPVPDSDGSLRMRLKLSSCPHQSAIDRTGIQEVDPQAALLDYSTLLGGRRFESAVSIAVDQYGCTYIVGATMSSDFPVVNPFDSIYSGGDLDDGFIAKISSSGSSLEYCTYIGGGLLDEVLHIAIDDSGHALIVGYTESTDFPIRSAFDSVFNNGSSYSPDAFMAKLSPGGDSLVFSTYFGGAAWEYGMNINLDKENNILIAGMTSSSDFPTRNAYDASLNNEVGIWDGFVAKFSPDCKALIFSTYLGGEDYDLVYEISVDSAGFIYVAGQTESSGFPVRNALFPNLVGNSDAFVCKLSPDGGTLVYSTYLGGSNNEKGGGLAVDKSGSVFVVGYTTSPDYPLRNPFQSTYGGGNMDIFVSKLSPTADSLEYSTFIGGSGFDEALSMTIDDSGFAYLCGITTSGDFPTQNAFQPYYQGGGDAIIAKLTPSGNQLVFSTYFGGTGSDYAVDLTRDDADCIYIVGTSSSIDFPVKNAYSPTQNGDSDAFTAKFRQGWICGDMNGDATINIVDILYLVDYLFTLPPGPPPVYLHMADVDGSGSLDIGDLLYLIEFSFGNPPGPAPVCNGPGLVSY